MARKSDIDFAMNGETSKRPEIEFIPSEPKEPKIEDGDGYVIFKLVDTNKKGGVYVPGIDDVINPATGKMERIRLLTGIPTIWLKEQKEVEKDYVNQNLRSLAFPRGQKILQIKKSDHTMLEFARVCSHNMANSGGKGKGKFDFFEYDPQAQQKALLEKEMLEIEMVLLAKEQPEEKMRKHAHYLGVMATDEYGFPKSPDGIRGEYILAAKRNPVKFKASLNSKEVEVSYLVKKAISEGKIDIGAPDSNINWANGGFITKLPVRASAYEYLVDLAMTNSKDGRDFLDQLQSVVK